VLPSASLSVFDALAVLKPLLEMTRIGQKTVFLVQFALSIVKSITKASFILYCVVLKIFSAFSMSKALVHSSDVHEGSVLSIVNSITIHFVILPVSLILFSVIKSHNSLAFPIAIDNNTSVVTFRESFLLLLKQHLLFHKVNDLGNLGMEFLILLQSLSKTINHILNLVTLGLLLLLHYLLALFVLLFNICPLFVENRVT